MIASSLPPDETPRLEALQALRALGADIAGVSSMLTLSGLNEDQMRYARTIENSGRALLTLVDQILDFSKLRVADPRMGHVSFCLAALIEEVAALISQRAGENRLRWSVADDVPPLLSGNPGRLRQVLTNLLGNAVNFTDTGEIRLDVRLESEPGNSPGQPIILRFTVVDTAIGHEPGAGLGLAISRQIVRLMGGDFDVHSLPGEGATFWFTGRFAPATPGAELTPPAPPQSGSPPARPLRVLIAEDNAVNQLVLSEQLAKLGHASSVVKNGVEALGALADSQWDAILLDCQMPVMDGYETVAAIRRAEAAAEGRRLWVIAVNGTSADGEREACLRAGMDDFLSKPFQVQRLAEAMARVPAGSDGAPRTSVDPALLAGLGKSRTVNGQNLLDRMVNLFTESGPVMLDQMDQAIRQADFSTAIRSVHKLSGGCSYFGARDLYILCSDFERLGRLGDHSALRSLAPRIRQEYARVEIALRRTSPSPATAA